MFVKSPVILVTHCIISWNQCHFILNAAGFVCFLNREALVEISGCVLIHCSIHQAVCVGGAVFLKSEHSGLLHSHLQVHQASLLPTWPRFWVGGARLSGQGYRVTASCGALSPTFSFLLLGLESRQSRWNSKMSCKWKSQTRQQPSRSLDVSYGYSDRETLCHHVWAAVLRIALEDDLILASEDTSSDWNITVPLFKKEATNHAHTLVLWLTWIFSLYQLLPSQESLQLASTWH